MNAYLKISSLNIPSKDLDFFLTNVLIKITKEICFKECPLECDTVKYQYTFSSKDFDLQKRLAYFKSTKISIDPSYEKSNIAFSHPIVLINLESITRSVLSSFSIIINISQ